MVLIDTRGDKASKKHSKYQLNPENVKLEVFYFRKTVCFFDLEKKIFLKLNPFCEPINQPILPEHSYTHAKALFNKFINLEDTKTKIEFIKNNLEKSKKFEFFLHKSSIFSKIITAFDNVSH